MEGKILRENCPKTLFLLGNSMNFVVISEAPSRGPLSLGQEIPEPHDAALGFNTQGSVHCGFQCVARDAQRSRG